MSGLVATLHIPAVIFALFLLVTSARAGLYAIDDLDEFRMTVLNTVASTGIECDIGLRIYHSCDILKWKDFCIDEAQELFKSDYYDKNKCTVFVGIPFMTHLARENLKDTLKAVLSRCEYNIVLLNNSNHTNVYFWQYKDAVENVYKDAQVFAGVLNQALDNGLVKRDCILSVGYSLAANSMGHVCRRLKHPCRAIYAIDPAGRLFSPPGPSVKESHFLVSQKDACHVVYLLCTHDVLGTKHRLGHINIILNDGQMQPNCRKGILNKAISGLSLYCSHNYCNKLFAKAVESPGSCVAKKYEVLEGGAVKYLDMPGYSLDLEPDEGYSRCGDREPEIFYLGTSDDDSCIMDP